MTNTGSLLTRGVAEVLPAKKGLEDLMRKRKIRLYLGIDPSTPVIHLGHAVVLRKLKQFQNLGHEVILLIGDFTGRIGDPTDKSATRQKLTHEQVLKNAKTYKEQMSKVLSFSGHNAVKIKFNSEWLDKLSFKEIVELASVFTVQQLIERDMFQKRIKDGKPIGLHEFLYPLMQAYDSVAMDVDLEVGGTDQTFNMLAGRTLMKAVKGKEKYVLTVPLLVGSDGQKMSKSLNNFIAVSAKPEEMYGQIMAISDDVVKQYFDLCTDLEIDLKNLHPMDAKKKLAHELVKMYHSESSAKSAQDHFEQTFQKKKPVFSDKMKLAENLAKTIAPHTPNKSISDAKRLVAQGAVEVNGEVVKDPIQKVEVGDKIRIGSLIFGTAVK